MTDCTLTKRELDGLNRRLTNAKKSGDPKKVLAVCSYANYVFETKGYPDCWSDWQRTAEDARSQLRRRYWTERFFPHLTEIG